MQRTLRCFAAAEASVTFRHVFNATLARGDASAARSLQWRALRDGQPAAQVWKDAIQGYIRHGMLGSALGCCLDSEIIRLGTDDDWCDARSALILALLTRRPELRASHPHHLEGHNALAAGQLIANGHHISVTCAVALGVSLLQHGSWQETLKVLLAHREAAAVIRTFLSLAMMSEASNVVRFTFTFRGDDSSTTIIAECKWEVFSQMCENLVMSSGAPGKDVLRTIDHFNYTATVVLAMEEAGRRLQVPNTEALCFNDFIRRQRKVCFDIFEIVCSQCAAEFSCRTSVNQPSLKPMGHMLQALTHAISSLSPLIQSETDPTTQLNQLKAVMNLSSLFSERQREGERPIISSMAAVCLAGVNADLCLRSSKADRFFIETAATVVSSFVRLAKQVNHAEAPTVPVQSLTDFAPLLPARSERDNLLGQFKIGSRYLACVAHQISVELRCAEVEGTEPSTAVALTRLHFLRWCRSDPSKIGKAYIPVSSCDFAVSVSTAWSVSNQPDGKSLFPECLAALRTLLLSSCCESDFVVAQQRLQMGLGDIQYRRAGRCTASDITPLLQLFSTVPAPKLHCPAAVVAAATFSIRWSVIADICGRTSWERAVQLLSAVELWCHDANDPRIQSIPVADFSEALRNTCAIAAGLYNAGASLSCFSLVRTLVLWRGPDNWDRVAFLCVATNALISVLPLADTASVTRICSVIDYISRQADDMIDLSVFLERSRLVPSLHTLVTDLALSRK